VRVAGGEVVLLWWWENFCEGDSLVLGDGDASLAGAERWKRRLHCQDSVLAEGALDVFRVGALGQEELTVVLAVHALAVRLLLVLGVHLKSNGTKIKNNKNCTETKGGFAKICLLRIQPIALFF
jgi:hypothetical protein